MLWLNSFNFRKMIKNKWNFNPSPEKIDIALSKKLEVQVKSFLMKLWDKLVQ